MNRLLMTCLISVTMTLSALGSEPANKESAPAPTTHPAKTEAKEAQEKTKEEKKAELKASREEKKAEQMAEAAKKCSESIAKVQERIKDMPEGEGKDMVNHFINHAKIEETALQNKNMTSHWNLHNRKCKSYVKKAEGQAKKRNLEKKTQAESAPKK